MGSFFNGKHCCNTLKIRKEGIFMEINYVKILEAKSNRNYTTMATDSVVQFTKKAERILTESHDVISKHISDICKNPMGSSFIRYASVTDKLSADDIAVACESLSADDQYRPHLEAAMNYKRSNESLRNDSIYTLACARYVSACLYESTYLDEIELIGYNINTSPETIDRYSKLLSRIEIDEYDNVCMIFPDMLKKNTELILGLRIVVSGQIANMLISLPLVICKRLKYEGTPAQRRSFIKVIDSSIGEMKAYLKNGDSRHYNLYIGYLDNLYEAKKELMKTVTENCVSETIADMQPVVGYYEESIIEDPVGELEEVIASIVFDDDEEISMETMYRLARIERELETNYEVTTEGKINKIIQKGAAKIERGSAKLASKLDAQKKENDVTKTSLKKAASPFVNAINKTINDIKDMDNKERRERIITNEFKLKLTKNIEKGILIIAGAGAATAAFGPIAGAVVALIGVLTGIAVDKALDAKVKRMIIKELEEELAVVNEKLEDVRGDNNKEKKYQLIRIKKKLETDLERVKYNLKSS
jgi:hypothetical protein